MIHLFGVQGIVCGIKKKLFVYAGVYKVFVWEMFRKLGICGQRQDAALALKCAFCVLPVIVFMLVLMTLT